MQIRAQLTALTWAGILQSVKGTGGGYCLARPIRSVTLLEIIEAANGRIDGVSQTKNEALETALALVSAATRRILSDVTLADLIGVDATSR